MAVAQLPVNAFAGTLDFDEEPEVVAVEEEQEQDTSGDPSYTWEGFSYYYDSNTKTLTVEGEGEYPGSYLLHNDYVDGIISNVDKIVLNTKGALSAYQLFISLDKVKEIDLSGFDTGNVTDMSEMFNECRSLKKVNLTGVDTSKVTNMYWMFWGCESLEEVDVTGFDTSNVTSMEGMFCQCSSLETLDLSKFNTGNVTNMWDMFRECRSLISLDLSGFDTSNVTNMGCMFGYCENLTSLKVSGFNTGNVTNMQDMFENCKSLQMLDLKSFNTDNVKNMAGMFGVCASLEDLDLTPFDVSNVEKMDHMFAGCSSLRLLDLSSWDVSKVNSFNYFLNNCNNLQTFKTPYNNNKDYTLPVTMTDQNGKKYIKGNTPVRTINSLTLSAIGTQEGPDKPGDANYAHKLTLSNASDYNSVVIRGKNVYKGDSVGFNDGDRIVVTGLGLGTGMDKNWSTYIVKWSYKGDKESGYEYGDGYTHDGGLFALNPTEDIELTVEARRIPVSAITAKGKLDGAYNVTANAASKKGNYINLSKHKADTKVTFAVKKTGKLNYEIASDAATIKFGAGNPEPVSLTKEKNSYSYVIPFMDIAQLAYSDTPAIEFTTAVAAKLPAPTVKVTSSTDIDETLSLDVPKAAKGLSKLWYRIEGKAKVDKNKPLPEGMAESVGPLYVPASVTSLTVDLTAKEGMESGDGAPQKYDFTATLLQLENEPEHSDKPLTDKNVVEGADGGNVVGASPEKKVSGSTKKPGYEEKLGLNKKQTTFICGEGGDDGILLATAKYSKNTTFRSLAYAKIVNTAGETVKSSDNEDDSKKILLDGDSIILETTDDLTPGKYTLSVLPVSKVGSQLPKAATLALTVKQGIDKLTVSVPQQSYVKKAKKALTIKPTVTYNEGDKTKTPANTKLNWEVLDADGNVLTDASPLYGKVTINQKNGTVTVAKDLVVSGDANAYRFMIMATAADYADNMASAKSGVIELTEDITGRAELKIQIVHHREELTKNAKVSDRSFVPLSGVVKSNDGKYYVTGNDIFFRINDKEPEFIYDVRFIYDGHEYRGGTEYTDGVATYDLGKTVPQKAIKENKPLLLEVIIDPKPDDWVGDE